VIFEVNNETDEKTKVESQPIIEKYDGRKKAKWQKLMISQGQIFRIEW